jgi:2,4-didehydro-3-deoxy-L-rhamnonate hydrolase
MKLIRFGSIGAEKPGLIINGLRKDCSAYFTDWDNDFFQNNGLNKLEKILQSIGTDLPTIATENRWAPCIARPRKTICVGLNYQDHATEVKAEMPQEPTIFFKATSAITGPYDDIIIPQDGYKTDWEVELGVIIKKHTQYLDTPESAKEYIAGYTISHDVSERSFQLERCGQWVKGKSCDSFNPIGPYLATTDEIENVQNLKMSLMVNDVIRQNSSTKNMFFCVDYLIYYISQFMSLEAGDLISTGTPAGVGAAMDPPLTCWQYGRQQR